MRTGVDGMKVAAAMASLPEGEDEEGEGEGGVGGQEGGGR